MCRDQAYLEQSLAPLYVLLTIAISLTEGYNISMEGRRLAHVGLPEAAGIIPRAVFDIFAAIKKRRVELGSKAPPVSIYCSFVQIYNEQVCGESFVKCALGIGREFHL